MKYLFAPWFLYKSMAWILLFLAFFCLVGFTESMSPKDEVDSLALVCSQQWMTLYLLPARAWLKDLFFFHHCWCSLPLQWLNRQPCIFRLWFDLSRLISDTWTRSIPSSISTNTPKSVTLVTIPVTSVPGLYLSATLFHGSRVSCLTPSEKRSLLLSISRTIACTVSPFL